MNNWHTPQYIVACALGFGLLFGVAQDGLPREAGYYSFSEIGMMVAAAVGMLGWGGFWR